MNTSQLRRHSMPPVVDDETRKYLEEAHKFPLEPTSFLSRTKGLPTIPYHVFDRPEKLRILFLVSVAGFFSPLSSNIYFPALGAISQELHVSPSVVNLTITVFMIAQGIAPSFWAPIADAYGRRVVYIGTFATYVLANVVLGAVKNFAALMVFRAVQAAGSAATISIGAGVISDMATSAERGGFVGTYGGVRMFGQSIGPVFGGLLAQFLGFRSIFWALAIMGTITLLLILFILPETLRSIGGNGTVRLYGIHKPWIYKFRRGGQPGVLQEEPDGGYTKPKLTLNAFVAPLRFVFEKDVFVTLVFGGVVYTVWSMITSSTTTLFLEIYHLSNLQIGLAFLPNGLGCIIGSYATGVLMDRDYAQTVTEYLTTAATKEAPATAPTTIPTKISLAAHPRFPIERARLRNQWWVVAAFVACVAGYGFSLGTDIDLPLILQFLISLSATAVFSMNSALVIDLYPAAAAGATASNNLVRCSMGAVGVAVVETLIRAVQPRFAFLGLAALTAATAPLVWIEAKWGMGWRLARAERLEREKRPGDDEIELVERS